MITLPDDVTQELFDHLRKAIEREAKRNAVAPVALDEALARHMFERAATRAKEWEQFLKAAKRKQPTPLKVLAKEFVVLYADHTGALPGRTERAGGPGGRMLLLLANGAGFVDLVTGNPYTIRQSTDAIKETRDQINKKAGLKAAPHYVPGGEEGTNLAAFDERDYRKPNRAREQARIGALTDIVGYEDNEGNPVSGDDPDSSPIFDGHQRVPDREHLTAVMRVAAANVLKEG